ncbi:MAG: hypothetical protein U5R14_11330 [Gemmatimonadota bacterium]|nr:hypothetical protein [Gemmatimonadota bacterium]
MPVFTRHKDAVLVLTADGDYTPGELERVGARAFDHRGDPGPVILDLSGAAGLETKSAESLAAEGTALATHRDRISRLAVVVSSRFADLFEADAPFVAAVGVDVRACPSHGDAVRWLSESGRATL